MADTSAPYAAAPLESRPIRWRPYAVVMSALTLAVLGVRMGVEEISSVATFAGILLGGLITLVWFFLRAGFSGTIRAAGAVALALAAVGLLAGGIRFNGWRGDMWPDISFGGGRGKQLAEFPAKNLPGKPADPATKTPEGDPKAPSDPAQPTEPKVDMTPTAHDFAGFLGTDRTGIVRGVKLAKDWQANPPKELWRRPVGLGWSAFAVVGQLAVTQEQRGDQEVVVAYELRTGKELWTHADANRFSEALGGDGPRATPTISRGRIFALGAAGVLNCLEGQTGKLVWSHNILKDARAPKNIQWGMSGSPLVTERLVVVNPGGPDGYSIVAYDRESGEMVWHSGSGQAAYSSPMLAKLAGVEMILLLNGPGLEAYAIEDGRPLWAFDWKTSGDQMINVSQPIVLPGVEGKPDRVLISTGYGMGSVMLEVKHSDGWHIDELWRSKKMRAKFTNVVVRDGYAYGIDEKILACMDLADGTSKWRERAGQYDYGQILLVDDVILVQAESGDVALVSATPEKFQELARISPLSNKTWNNAALAGRLLLVRNDREAVCYELAAEVE